MKAFSAGWRFWAPALVGAAAIALIAAYALKARDQHSPPPPLSLDGVITQQDIAYAPGHRHGLDIYAPPAADGLPVVIYIHGGAWTSGSKQEGAWLGAELARKGHVVVVPDYRLHPEVVWPAFIEDNAQAVRWVHDNIANHGGDPGRVVLIGHSAGALNAVTLAIDPRWLARVGLDSRRDLKGVVGLSGVYNMIPLWNASEKAIFAPETGYRDMLDRIDGKSPPVLLVVGAGDRTAGPEDTRQTVDAIRKHGGDARAIVYPDLDHSASRDELAGIVDRPRSSVAKDVLDFIAAKTGGAAGGAAPADGAKD